MSNSQTVFALAAVFAFSAVGCGTSVNIVGSDDSGAVNDSSIGSADSSPSSDAADASDTSASDAGSDAIECIGASMRICSDGCVNTSTDSRNCGSCGKSCESGTACVDGACGACPSSAPTICGTPAVCSDLQKDSDNCGACGTKCPKGSSCDTGVCACTTGLVKCADGCKDLSKDVTACGSCTNACGTGSTCVSGACVCPGSSVKCGSACADVSSDDLNCGGCGIVCGGKCISGSCTCTGGKKLCGGSCVDTSTDATNCGACGASCPSPGTCSTGHCSLPTCRVAPPKVLFYGALGSMEKPYLPTGTTSVIASDATWRTMTASDFSAYDLIVLGAPDSTSTSTTSAPTVEDYQAAFDTRAIWSSVIDGRIAVLGMDPGYHAMMGTTGASTLLRATLSWLTTNPIGTTALYVNSDWGTRKLDFLASLGAFSSSDEATLDTVTILSMTHPMMLGSTDSTLSGWSSSAHSTVSFPTGFTSLATGSDTFTTTVTGPVVVVRDGVTCLP